MVILACCIACVRIWATATTESYMMETIVQLTYSYDLLTPLILDICVMVN